MWNGINDKLQRERRERREQSPPCLLTKRELRRDVHGGEEPVALPVVRVEPNRQRPDRIGDHVWPPQDSQHAAEVEVEARVVHPRVRGDAVHQPFAVAS